MNVATRLALQLDPSLILAMLGFAADPWQRDALRSKDERILMLCARQTGKSTTTAAIGLCTALLNEGATILLLAPSQRQSGEIFRKVVGMWRALGRPIPAERETLTELGLANGSRVVCLPGDERTIRGYSDPSLVVCDEAAQAEDSLLLSLSPMLSVSHGRMIWLSTPYGRRGTFWEAWHAPDSGWHKIRVTSAECPRHDPAFVAAERSRLGERWWAQEFMCAFVATQDQVFDPLFVERMFTSDARPLYPPRSSAGPTPFDVPDSDAPAWSLSCKQVKAT